MCEWPSSVAVKMEHSSWHSERVTLLLYGEKLRYTAGGRKCNPSCLAGRLSCFTGTSRPRPQAHGSPKAWDSRAVECSGLKNPCGGCSNKIPHTGEPAYHLQPSLTALRTRGYLAQMGLWWMTPHIRQYAYDLGRRLRDIYFPNSFVAENYSISG